jgi:hypothetical protein
LSAPAPNGWVPARGLEVPEEVTMQGPHQPAYAFRYPPQSGRHNDPANFRELCEVIDAWLEHRQRVEHLV